MINEGIIAKILLMFAKFAKKILKILKDCENLGILGEFFWEKFGEFLEIFGKIWEIL